MKNIVYLNGDFLPASEAKVSMFDRGYMFGDGVYEVLPVVNYTLLDVEPFLERFTRSLRELELKWPISKNEYIKMFEDLIKKNDLKEGGIYTQVTRGVAPREFTFPQNVQTTCSAFTFAKKVLENEESKNGVKVVSVEDIRWKRRDIKSIALLGQCMAKEEAHKKGAYEGWMVEDGLVTEGTSSSAYIVKDGKIITKPLSNAILPGIRRKLLLKLAKEHDVEVVERAFSIEEAMDADEALLSSATTFVLPIVQINDKIIADGKPGPIYKMMRKMYIESALKVAGVKIYF